MMNPPNKPKPKMPEPTSPAAVTPEKKELGYTLEELDELEPLECCPGCLTHPNHR